MVSFELAVGGSHAAPRIAVVDDVVVNQSRSVKQFQSSCKIYDPVLFFVFVRVDRDIAKGHGRTPAPIGKASAKSLATVKERFGYRGEGIGVRRNFGDFTMRLRDDFSQIFGNAVNER